MENMDFHGFQRYVFSLLRYEANVIMYYYLIQQKCGHDLSSWQMSAKLPGWRWVGMLPVHWLLFGDKIPVMDSWFSTSYIAGQNVVWVGTVDSQQFWTRFHPKWLLKWRQPNQDGHVKYSGCCHSKYPLLCICRTSLVDLPSSVFQQHVNNHPWSPQLDVQHGGHLPVMFGHV